MFNRQTDPRTQFTLPSHIELSIKHKVEDWTWRELGLQLSPVYSTVLSLQCFPDTQVATPEMGKALLMTHPSPLVVMKSWG
jgi:hypothetical protein